MTSNQILWAPSEERIAKSNLTRFAELAQVAYGAPQLGTDIAKNWTDLWHWSVMQRAAFWNAMVEFAGLRAERGPGDTLQGADLMPGARWYPGMRLNFAENLLSRNDQHTAIVFVNDQGDRREISYSCLQLRVARVAAGLAEVGVGPGDVVAGYLPNMPETVIAMLATASRGAIWTCCSPDFGVNGVVDRFGQVRPKVIFAADGYTYAGKRIDCSGPIAEILRALDSVEHVVIVPYANATSDFATIPNVVRIADFERDGTLTFVRMPFDAPLFIMYSSGTTGAPKCIVHGIGGTLLQHRKEHLLHSDLREDDRLFFYTTCGWMLWNWLVSALATGSTIILFDGSPFHPKPDVLWRMAEREQVTHFGTSPKYLAALEKAGYEPAHHFELRALRMMLSTGSPLAAEQFDYVYRAVKQDIHLASISGGTDILSCFCLGNPWLPVRRGEIQCRGLGMAVEVWNEDGHALVEEQGELVCTRAFPSMPIGFWNDADGAKYQAAYFKRFPNNWHHGDYASLTAHDGIVISGRSDSVLNPGGVRIGTAEIYRAVEKLPEILEAIAIGQKWHNDVRVVLFVRLRHGSALDETLRKRIMDSIQANTTPRHVPAKIVAVADIPRTISGKIVEVAVRNVVHGVPVTNALALANPEALEYFRDLPELLT
jgi:acetoacetyl-CoA synthetase